MSIRMKWKYSKKSIALEEQVQVGHLRERDYLNKVPLRRDLPGSMKQSQFCALLHCLRNNHGLFFKNIRECPARIYGSIFTGVPTSTKLYNSIASLGYM